MFLYIHKIKYINYFHLLHLMWPLFSGWSLWIQDIDASVRNVKSPTPGLINLPETHLCSSQFDNFNFLSTKNLDDENSLWVWPTPFPSFSERGSMNMLMWPFWHYSPTADDTGLPCLLWLCYPMTILHKRELNYTMLHVNGSIRIVMYSLSIAFNNLSIILQMHCLSASNRIAIELKSLSP